MADLEMVINGLREMSCRATWKDIDRIRHKFQPIINDAIALLKAQEPRVLTLDELRNVKPGTVLWEMQNYIMPAYPVEFKGFDAAPINDGSEAIEIIAFGLGFEEVDEYGKQYILWTAKPADEQRRRVKWND